MQLHAQSTTLAESRIPYMHLGYVSASPSTGFGTFDSDIFVPSTILFLVGYLIALKFPYGWLIGGMAGLLKKIGVFKLLAGIFSMLLIFTIVFVYCFTSLFR